MNRGWPANNELFCDECLYEASPWQIIGPGHLRHLGSAPPGSGDLGSGRLEVSVGQPSEWMLAGEPSVRLDPENPRVVDFVAAPLRDAAVLGRAERLLGACILPVGPASKPFVEQLARRRDQAR